MAQSNPLTAMNRLVLQPTPQPLCLTQPQEMMAFFPYERDSHPKICDVPKIRDPNNQQHPAENAPRSGLHEFLESQRM